MGDEHADVDGSSEESPQPQTDAEAETTVPTREAPGAAENTPASEPVDAPETVIPPAPADIPPVPPIPADIPSAPETVPPAPLAPAAAPQTVPDASIAAAAAPGVQGAARPTAPAVAAPTLPALSPAMKAQLLPGLSTVGIALGAAFIGGVLLAGLLVGLGGEGISLSSIPVSLEDFVGAGQFMLLAFTLLGVVLGGELRASFSGEAGWYSASGDGAIWVFPLLLTVGALVAVLWWSIRQERRAPLTGIGARAIVSAATGLATGLVALVISLVFALRADESGVRIAITSAGVREVLAATILVGLAVFVGRTAASLARDAARWTTAVRVLFAALPAAVREGLSYAAAAAAVFGLIGVIITITQLWDGIGPNAIVVAVLGVLNIAPVLVALGHLGGIESFASFGSHGESNTLTVFDIGTPWIWLLVVVAVLLAVVAAIWIGARRARSAQIDWSIAWRFPVVVLVGWILLGLFFFGASGALGGDAGFFSGGGAAGVALSLWTPVVLFIWAAAIELGAQLLPTLTYRISPALLGVIAGRATAERWLSGVPVAPVPQAAQPQTWSGVPPVGQPGADAAASNVSIAASPQPGAPVAAVAEPRPLSPQTKKALLWSGIGAGALVLVVVAGAVAVGILNGARSAQSVAETYLQHIADGDAEAASALVDPNVATAERELLTDDVLGAATERISDIRVAEPVPAGEGTATVAVSFKLDGITYDSVLGARTGDPEWLVLDTWELTTPLTIDTVIGLTGPGDVSIGGVVLPVTDEYGYSEAQVVMYPAVYEAAAVDADLFELDDPRVLVAPDGATYRELAFVATDALVAEVQAQSDALIDACAAQKVAQPEDCPLSAWIYSAEGDITWTVETYPTVEISSDGSGFRAEGGAATVSYVSSSFFSKGETKTDDEEIDYNGTIEIVDGEVVVSHGGYW